MNFFLGTFCTCAVFINFCSLVDEKINIKVLACSLEITGVLSTDQPDTTSTVRTSTAPQINCH